MSINRSLCLLSFLLVLSLLFVSCSSETDNVEFCGGIAAIPCDDGYFCKLEGDFPDAGGTCVKLSDQIEVVVPESPSGGPLTPGAPVPPSADPATSSGTPYDHELILASSATGDDWVMVESPLLEHASVPDAIVLHSDIGNFKAGTIMSVFVYFSEAKAGVEQIGLIYSEDGGLTWSDLQILELDNLGSLLPVDPSIVQLDDGTLLVYFFDFSLSGLPSEQVDSYGMYVASSTDGLSYLVESSPVYSSENFITDPDVIYFNDQWYLYFVAWGEESSIMVSTGDSPYSFEFQSDTGVQGIPGTLLSEQEGVIELYGCDSGITKLTSDDGFVFSLEDTYMLPGCDPAPLRLSDGSSLIVFKGFGAVVGQKPVADVELVNSNNNGG